MMRRALLQNPEVASRSRRSRGICAQVAGLLVATSVFLGAGRCRADVPSGAAVELFEKKVRPILVEKCQRCHGSALQKGGLRLDSRDALLKGGESGPVVSPGHPEKSELVRAINYEADGFQMPPTGKLDADSIGALTEWIREGAAWPASSSGGGGPSATQIGRAHV